MVSSSTNPQKSPRLGDFSCHLTMVQRFCFAKARAPASPQKIQSKLWIYFRLLGARDRTCSRSVKSPNKKVPLEALNVMVPETGLEPAHQMAYAPKAYVYTNFTTRARCARPRLRERALVKNVRLLYHTKKRGANCLPPRS